MSSRSPLVSILVPTYNAAPFLTELCDSIQAQTYQNFEVLILDDGSSDRTSEVLASFEKDPRFKIFKWSPNRGVNAATSALLNQMKGTYWCNPGADDVLYPDFVTQRVGLLESRPEAVMVHGPAEYIDALSNPHKVDFPNLKMPASMSGKRALSVLLQHNILSTSSLMLRADITRLFLSHFLCNWKYAQDWYLWLLHAASGFDLLWDNQVLHKYRVHESSLSCNPAHEAVRLAEIRLVPLCALSAAAQFSPLAGEFWAEWRQTLYHLWLYRAAKLRAEGRLQPEWLRLAGRAYHGKNKNCASLFRELCLNGLGIPITGLKERDAIRRQSFRVSGIAQINDPIFSERM